MIDPLEEGAMTITIRGIGAVRGTIGTGTETEREIGHEGGTGTETGTEIGTGTGTEAGIGIGIGIEIGTGGARDLGIGLDVRIRIGKEIGMVDGTGRMIAGGIHEQKR